MQSSITVVEHNIKIINTWLKEISQELGDIGEDEAWTCLRAALQTLRDRIPVDEAADFAAQLPTLARGLYYEAWQPSQTPLKWRDRDDYLQAVASKLGDTADSEETMKAVLRVLARHLDNNELNRVRDMHPSDVWDLWPQ